MNGVERFSACPTKLAANWISSTPRCSYGFHRSLAAPTVARCPLDLIFQDSERDPMMKAAQLTRIDVRLSY